MTKNNLFVPKRTMVSENMAYGICLWRLEDGNYIEDSQGNKLNCPGRVGNKTIEKKMRAAARDCGVFHGEPFWLPGFRRVTQMEYDDQMEDLIDGKVPDLADAYWQAKHGI